MGRGVAETGKDREGHGLGEHCAAGAVWEAAGWGGCVVSEEEQPGLFARDRVQKVHQHSQVQSEVGILVAFLCQAREGIDYID